jgi:DNA-binding transcriptional LysR family regulator
MRMDVSNLQIFVEVVRAGSFAAVARVRDVDPSIVSRAVSSLEQELGARLFHRTTRKLTPTEAGIAYFDRVASAVDELIHANEAASEVASQPNGLLRLTVSASFGQLRVVPLLPKFAALYPQLAIELILNDTMLDLVTERIDLAVRLGALEDSSLVAKRLMQIQFHVCASPAYLKKAGRPRNPNDVAQHNCLIFPVQGSRSRWRFKGPGSKVTEVAVDGRVIISNSLALRQCALAGMGLSLLPNWLIADQLRDGSLVSLFPNMQISATHFNTAAWLVHPSRNHVPLKVKAMIEFLKQHIREAS